MQNKKTESSPNSFQSPAIRWVAVAALSYSVCAAPLFGTGAESFKAKCVACHGADGSGSTPMGKKFKLRDLRSADVQKQTGDELTSIIAKGKPPMPAFDKSLNAAAIEDLVAYIRTIKN